MTSLGSMIPRSRKAVLLAGAVLFVVALAAGIWVGPIAHQFARLDESIASQEKRLARNLRTIAPGSKDAVLKAYQEYGDTIPKRGSTAEEAAAMLAEIEKIASDLGVALASTKPREPKIEKDFEEYKADIEVECKMKQLLSLLYGLESSPQLLRVERVALDLKEGESGGSLRGALVVSKCVTL